MAKSKDKQIAELKKILDNPNISVLVKSKAREKIKELESSSGSDNAFRKVSDYFYKWYKVNLPDPGDKIKFRGREYKVFSVDKAGIELGNDGDESPILSTAIYPFIKEYFQGYKKVFHEGKVYLELNGERKTVDQLAKEEDLSQKIVKSKKVGSPAGIKTILPDEPKPSDVPDTDDLLNKLKNKKATRKKSTPVKMNKKEADKLENFRFFEVSFVPTNGYTPERVKIKDLRRRQTKMISYNNYDLDNVTQIAVAYLSEKGIKVLGKGESKDSFILFTDNFETSIK